MLPNPALKPAWDKLVWVYVYRDFSGNEADRRAERILWRFGVSSWPQLFLADPRDLTILAHTGRTVESFLDAVERTTVEPTRDTAPVENMLAAEKRADDLEKRPSAKQAARLLDDPDLVVRFAALRILADKRPKLVAERAAGLLETPNDPFRYEVCRVLAKAGDPAAREALEALVREPRQSLNPNVLRIRAVEALAACGDARSVDAIRPHAASGEVFNGLTGIAVDALAAIGARDRKARAAVEAALKASYPPPPAAGADDRTRRACLALAKRVHKALGGKRPFPDVYDEKSRARLMK